MNLYLETSALVKLYVEERGRTVVVKAVNEAEIVATSMVAYVEARAAFARRCRGGVLAPAEYRRSVRDLDGDWSRYLRFEVAEALVRAAGRLAERYRLRAYDAVHLASALVMRDQLGEVNFACWDSGLNAAARRAGLTLLPA
ncbi:MAG: type II toxin-antitoxin system VapC family toxin [Armatimonadetes bacterium]|nr:type II toxin-antitoxin system VapC family toxin [Armatimonadota bacterium]